MKHVLKIVYFVFSILFLSYLSLPINTYPLPLPDSLLSNEPADMEDTNRRGYFTDLNREEVITHYKETFGLSILPNNRFLPLRLNYPPEESQEIIRDQTRSTYLEELTYPLRESIFINGFEPKLDQDEINIEGNKFHQKVIVKHVSSNILIRLFLGVLTIIALILLLEAYILEFPKFLKGLLWLPKKIFQS